MIVLATLAILFAMGLPSFGRLLHDIAIRGSAEGLRAALQAARTEAVTRNTLVRLLIGNASGMPGWTMGCVHVSDRCPAIISRFSASTDTKTRWGSAGIDSTSEWTKALAAGQQMPAVLTFNALGAAPGISKDSEAARIDVMHSEDIRAKRLVVFITPAGAVRLCDPAVTDDVPMRCH